MSDCVKKILNLADVRTDGGTQTRTALDEDAVAEYARMAALEGGAGAMPLPDVCFDGRCYYLIDGFHRMAALAVIGILSCECSVYRCGLDEARWRAAAANKANAVRRDAAARRRALEMAIEARERVPSLAGQSNRQMAAHVGVDEATVRRALEARDQRRRRPDAEPAATPPAAPKPPTAKPKSKTKANAPLTDDDGTPVPPEARDAFADPALADCEALVRGWADAIDPDAVLRRLADRSAAWPYAKVAHAVESLERAAHLLTLAAEDLAAGLPSAVCFRCAGLGHTDSGVCQGCRGGGHLPRWRHQELLAEGGS